MDVIALNLSDGRTLRIDLEDETEAKRWKETQESLSFQSLITGISILNNGTTYALPTPKHFQSTLFRAELVRNGGDSVVGEKIVCNADEVEATLLVYRNGSPPMARFGLAKLGKQRFRRLQ